MKKILIILIALDLPMTVWAAKGYIDITPSQNIINGLIGWYTFDGKNMISNIADSSGQGNTGRLVTVTSTTTVMGKIGQAFVSKRNTSTNAYIDASSDYIGTTALTICMWLYPYTNNGYYLSNGKAIMTTNSSNRFGLSRDGTVTSATSATNAVVLFKWRYYCATSNTSGTTNLYVDGILTGTANQAAGTPAAGTTNVRLLGEGAGNALDGIVDDIRIYNRVISINEIIVLYNNGISHIDTHLSYAAATVTRGLIGWWSFDGKELINNVTDSSGNNRNGNLVGYITATTTASGRIGQALRFDGSTQYVNLGNVSAFDMGTSDWTISYWIITRDTSAPITAGKLQFLGGGNPDGYATQISSTGHSRASLFKSGGTLFLTADDGTIVNDGMWHHITYVWNRSGNLLRYVDGVVTGTALDISADSGLSIANSQNFLIGARDVVDSYLNGVVDDVRVYNRALSSTEITSLYHLGVNIVRK